MFCVYNASFHQRATRNEATIRVKIRENIRIMSNLLRNSGFIGIFKLFLWNNYVGIEYRENDINVQAFLIARNSAGRKSFVVILYGLRGFCRNPRYCEYAQ